MRRLLGAAEAEGNINVIEALKRKWTMKLRCWEGIPTMFMRLASSFALMRVWMVAPAPTARQFNRTPFKNATGTHCPCSSCVTHTHYSLSHVSGPYDSGSYHLRGKLDAGRGNGELCDPAGPSPSSSPLSSSKSWRAGASIVLPQQSYDWATRNRVEPDA